MAAPEGKETGLGEGLPGPQRTESDMWHEGKSWAVEAGTITEDRNQFICLVTWLDETLPWEILKKKKSCNLHGIACMQTVYFVLP